MKRIFNLPFVLAFFFLPAAVALGQKGSFETGVHAGVSATRLANEGKPTESDFYFQPALSAGLDVLHNLSNHISIISGVSYTRVNSEREGMTAIQPGTIDGLPSDKYYYGAFRNRINLDYLEMPVLIRASTGNKISGYLLTGAFFGYNLAANSITTGETLIYSDAEGRKPLMLSTNDIYPEQHISSNRNVTDEIKRINVGLCEGIGLMYSKNGHKISIEGRYSFGVNNIWRDNNLSGINKTDNLVLQLGYSVQL